MKKAPPVCGAGKEYINALNKLYSTPSRPNDSSLSTSIHTCQGCGASFRPYREIHDLCWDCFHWNRALEGIEATRCALKGLL